MVHVQIEIVEGWPEEQRRALVRTLHAALLEVLDVDAETLRLRLVEHSEDRVAVPENHSNLFTAVAVSTLGAHTQAVEYRLREAIVRGVEASGVPREDVVVALGQPRAQRWRVLPEAPRHD